MKKKSAGLIKGPVFCILLLISFRVSIFKTVRDEVCEIVYYISKSGNFGTGFVQSF